MNIFVYGLSYRVKREILASTFAPYGEVRNARIIIDRETRRSKGYGFGEMDEAEGHAAIEALDGTELMGRTIHCAVGNERPPREEQVVTPAE